MTLGKSGGFRVLGDDRSRVPYLSRYSLSHVTLILCFSNRSSPDNPSCSFSNTGPSPFPFNLEPLPLAGTSLGFHPKLCLPAAGELPMSVLEIGLSSPGMGWTSGIAGLRMLNRTPCTLQAGPVSKPIRGSCIRSPQSFRYPLFNSAISRPGFHLVFRIPPNLTDLLIHARKKL